MNCKRCGLSRYRKNIVLSIGDVPADILFIGDAPSMEEDVLGRPFVGKNGKLLRKAINSAFALANIATKKPRIHLTNLCMCIPKDSKLEEARLPTSKEIEACWYWLEQVYLKVQPLFVVFLGRTPEKFLKKKIPNGIYLFHPSYIIKNGGETSVLFTEFIRELSELFLRSKKLRRTWK